MSDWPSMAHNLQRATSMISRLVLFGATGDLAARYLFPALAAMHAVGQLPASFTVLGTARDPLTDDEFRHRVADALTAHAPDTPPNSRAVIIAATRYAAVDIADATHVRRAIGIGDGGSPIGVYLALPPTLFEIATSRW